MFNSHPITTITLASDGGGEHIDPRRTDILATTDLLAHGRYLCQITITTYQLDDSVARFEVQHRDSTNDEDNPVESAVVAVPVDACQQFEFAFSVQQDDQICVIPYVNMIGTVTVAINFERLSN